MTVSIVGRVIDQETKEGVPGLRVEAWDRLQIYPQAVGSGITAKRGVFRITLDEEEVREQMFSGRPVILNFLVFQEDKAEALESTGQQTIYMLDDPAEQLSILVALPLPDNEWRRIYGHVLRDDQTASDGVLIRAFDAELGMDHPLGEAAALGGQYTLFYPVSDLQQAGKENADLIVRAWNGDGVLLAEAPVLKDAPADAEIDIRIDPASEPAESLSQYASHLLLLSSIVGEHSLAEIAASDLPSLAARTGIPEQQIAQLIEAMRQNLNTGFASEGYYGLLSRNLTVQPPELFALPGKTVLRALRQAIKKGIIPSLDTDEILSHFERLQTTYQPLAQVAPRIGLAPDAPIFAGLSKHKIDTLAGIREAGGLRHLAGLNASETEIGILESVAQLSLLPLSIEVVGELVQAGFLSPGDIAQLPRASFSSAVASILDLATAEQVHTLAGYQAHILDQALTVIRVQAGEGKIQSTRAALSSVVPQRCGCEECQQALSPLAYLADLLNYAVHHVRYQNNPIDLAFLESYFHQPFGGLPLSCDLLHQELYQIRICIEVLRQHLPLAYTQYTPVWYTETAYLMLLEQLGISYEDLRQARTWRDDDERRRLGARLGLFLDPLQRTTPDILDDLLVDPALVTEAQLQTLFGLWMTTNDPLQPIRIDSAYLDARILHLRALVWPQQDFPSNPPVNALPLIDPDVVSPADMIYTTLTPPGVFRTPSQPVHLWEDRSRQIQQWRLDIVQIAQTPSYGFNTLITDEALVGGVVRRLGVGIGISTQMFVALRIRREKGEDIRDLLAPLYLSVQAFDTLVLVWNTLHLTPPGVVLSSEWDVVYDILVQRLKQSSFSYWRSQESAMHLTLSPQYFRLRDSSATPWLPREWRTTVEMREEWIDKLQARIEQEQAIRDGIQAAMDAVEERLLGELRNELLRTWSLPGLLTRARLEALTQQLQIDFEAGACQKTTRIAQAIQTIQGILFGARTGLLEGGAFTLDAPNFDEEWLWIGSNLNWRSAMGVFFYPENALRPSLRSRMSPAFQAVIEALPLGIPISANDLNRVVSSYQSYFDDICSLTLLVCFQTGNWINSVPSPQQPTIVIAQAGSGKLYSSLFASPPYSSSSPGVMLPDHNYWMPIPDLPSDFVLTSCLPYRTELGKTGIALYGRSRQNGSEQIYRGNFDGTRWRIEPLPALPTLVVASEYFRQVIPAAPALQQAGVSGWRLNGRDNLITMVLEGYGSRNRTAILIIAGTTEADGSRRVGMLRGQEGGLILTALSTIDAAWRLPPGKPTLLFQGGVQRLLMTRPAGAGIDIGLLGVLWPQERVPRILWQTSGGSINGRSIKTRLVAADIDGDNATELLMLSLTSRTGGALGMNQTSTRVEVLKFSGVALNFHSESLIRNPYKQSPNSCYGPFAVEVNRLIPVNFGGYNYLLALGYDPAKFQGGANCDFTFHSNAFAWTISWNWTTNEFVTNRVVLETSAANNPPLPLERYDDFIAIDLPQLGQGVFPISPQHVDLAVITNPAGTSDLKVTWRSTAGAVEPPLPNPLLGSWTYHPTDQVMTLGFEGRRELLFIRADGSEFAFMDTDHTGKVSLRSLVSRSVEQAGAAGGESWALSRNAQYIGLDLDQDGLQEIISLTPEGRLAVLHQVEGISATLGQSHYLRSVNVRNVSARAIINIQSPLWTSARRAQIEAAYDANLSPSLRRYLDEAYYFVPVELALRLRESGQYQAALDWLRSVYDYALPALNQRKIAYKLVIDEQPIDPALQFQRVAGWLIDPLNAHSIAEMRPLSYARFTSFATVRCLLDYADSEFTHATSESIARARELYLEALELLNLPEIQQYDTGCSDVIGTLSITLTEPEYRWILDDILARLVAIQDRSILIPLVQQIKPILEDQTLLPAERRDAINGLIDAVPAQAPLDYAAALDRNRRDQRSGYLALMENNQTRSLLMAFGRNAGRGDGSQSQLFEWLQDLGINMRDKSMMEWLPGQQVSFCIPPNPIIQAVQLYASLNLYKTRTCRNISGMEMQVEPYALPTVSEAGLGSFGSGNALPTLRLPTLQPLPYRYGVLIERAKELARLAGQMEDAMSSALQGMDREAYNLLRAQQDLMLARAGVRLKDLQYTEAYNNIALATMQRQRAQIQQQEYARLYQENISTLEHLGLGMLATAATLYASSAASSFVSAYVSGMSVEGFLSWWAKSGRDIAQGLSSLATSVSTGASITSTLASYERRREEWRFQRDLATQDMRIGQQQVLLAQVEARITAQEQGIAQLEVDQTEVMLNFLNNQQFGSLALFEWMAGVLKQVYRYFLQQATAMARLAEMQLSFERQAITPPFIQADYWEPPTRPSGGAASEPTSDLYGVTGSARLLRDIYQLDQYAFSTDQRKLQLTETLSLAQYDPFAFQRFREAGVLYFDTPMSLFDQKFPGHYLRLIRRVRTSVIALIPPSQGIRATLSTGGSSRVVIRDTLFKTVRIQRGPESVALTMAMNATGVFEPDAQPDILIPFEGIGVDTSWEFRLPKAANLFDFNTIADVLITIDYTALDSFDYRQQVIQQLPQTLSADRPFSLRVNFSDAWWDLHNPDQVTVPFQATFTSRPEDFPANVRDVRIDAIVLYLSFAAGQTIAIDPLNIQFLPSDGGAGIGPLTERPVNNVISTRRGQWGALVNGTNSVSGTWVLSFGPDQSDPQRVQKEERLRRLFDGSHLDDILFVVTYRGRLPTWPT